MTKNPTPIVLNKQNKEFIEPSNCIQKKLQPQACLDPGTQIMLPFTCLFAQLHSPLCWLTSPTLSLCAHSDALRYILSI